MEPINYMLDVRNPIEEAIKGYTMGRNDIAQRQELQIQQQNAAMEQQAFADQQTALAEQRAAAAQQQAAAAAYQQDLMLLRDAAASGTLTPEMQNAFNLKYASNQAEIKTAFDAMSEPKRQEQTAFGINLVTSLLSGNADSALTMLDERILAADNSGNTEEAAKLRANRKIIEMDPYAAAISIGSAMTAADAIKPDVWKSILDSTQPKTPEGFQTLKLRAEAAGLVPGTPEYNQFMVSGGKPQEGMTIRSLPGGGFELVQGSVSGQNSRPTEGQMAATAYLQRMVGSEADISELEANGSTSLPYGASLIIDTELETSLSEDNKRLLQAQRDWVRAKLRKESGAEIPTSEVVAEMRTYFPQPGDGPEVIAQKRASRARAMTQMEVMSGAEPSTEEAPTVSEAPQAFISDPTIQRLVTQNANVGVTAQSIWNSMTAEERAAYGG